MAMAIMAITMDVTVTITASNASDGAGREKPARGDKVARRDKGGKPNDRGVALIGLALAALLLALGVPRLGGALLSLDAQDVLWRVQAGATVPVAELRSAEAAMAASGAWVADGEAEGDRGLLLLREAAAVPVGPERTRLLERTEAATVAGLARGPGQPGPWIRLAWLRRIKGDASGALAALRMSWLSGAFVPSMMTSRLDFALPLLPMMSLEMRSLLRRQFRLTWVVAPKYVAGLAERPELAAMVRDALADLSDEDVAQYVRLHGRRK